MTSVFGIVVWFLEFSSSQQFYFDVSMPEGGVFSLLQNSGIFTSLSR